MIKVGIDSSPLNNQNAYRGVGSYTANLIKSLEAKKEINLKVGDWRNFWKEVDLIHFPYFDLFFCTLPLIKKKKTVVTIHDCIPLVLSSRYPMGIKGRLKFEQQRISLRGVSAVLTDSESSQKDIIKYLKVPPEKITVVYLAASEIFKPIQSTTILRRIVVRYNLPKNFVLYVGDVNYNKNLLRLIEAFASVKEKDLRLVLVGKAFEDESLLEVRETRELIKKLSLEEEVKILGYVSGEDLPSIYNLASVYCQPSLYEGFGLQILEAMACGCPVVTSNVSSLPEVAGEAAVLVDPWNVDSIAGGIEKSVNGEKLREKMINAGYSQNRKFSWEKTVKETIKVYEKVLAK